MDLARISRGKAALLSAGLLLLLLLRYFQTYFQYDFPLGYDAGIYRYLFLKHGAAFPPFVLGDVAPWARGHPLGLFFFTTILMKLGVPADWLVGWIWNLVPVVLVCLLAVAAGRSPVFAGAGAARWLVGCATLLMGLLSAALFDGFFAMYWKTFAALLWMTLTFLLLDLKSPWAALPAFLTLVTHHQTGLLLALTLGLLWLVHIRRDFRSSRWLVATAVGALVCVFAAFLYLPVWEEAIGIHLDRLFRRGADVPAGSFPEAMHYVRISGILLAAGAFGFAHSLQRSFTEHRRSLTHWHLAVLVALAFVVFRLYFYRRFFLHLDFFFLPFAAYACVVLFRRLKAAPVRIALAALIAVQTFLSFESAQARVPKMDADTFAIVTQAAQVIPAGAQVLVLESESPPWFLGWMPDHDVGGPGLFGSPSWDLSQWETFLYGTNGERRPFLEGREYYLIATPLFHRYYGEQARAFLADPCIEPVAAPIYYRSACL